MLIYEEETNAKIHDLLYYNSISIEEYNKSLDKYKETTSKIKKYEWNNILIFA